MTKSQNTKSEQLTEQWEKRTLRNGAYYIKTLGGETMKGIYDDVAEVLAPVPSYDEWQAKLEENAQLKELLKECELWFTGIVGNMNDKNVGEHNRNLPIGNFEHIFKVFSQKINEVLK